MTVLRALSIRGKLLAILFVGVLMPMSIGLAWFTLQEVRALRRELVTTNSLLAYVAGQYSAAELAFDNKEESEETLRALTKLDQVVFAALYDSQGQLFSSYRKPSLAPGDTIPGQIAPPLEPNVEDAADHIDIYQPVVYNDVRYGTIQLRVSTGSLQDRIKAYRWSVILAALGLMAFVVGFAFALELTITRPLLSLAELARRITKREDYSVRATASRGDEIGTLSEAFNAMLSEIEKRQHEAREAARIQHLLASVSGALAESLDYPLTLSRVVRLLVQSFADFCVVDLVDEEQRIHRVAAAHADPEKEGALRELYECFKPTWDSPLPAAQVLRSGEPLLLPEVTDAVAQAHVLGAEHLRLIQRLGTRSVIAVPLVSHGKIFGALTLACAHPTRRYGPEDVNMAQELARRCAIALENARLYREAQEGIRIREEFLSVAAHELRTPLTALHLTTQRLRRLAPPVPGGGGEANRFAALIHAVEQQGKRLANLVGSLLDVARIDAGKLMLEPEEVDLVEVVRKVVDQFSDELLKAGCTVRLAAKHPLIGWWDSSRLEQVVTNLLSNALKYGAGKPIDVTVEAFNGAARLIVHDHGIGITEEDKERIFARFERAVSVRHYGGLGLGLYITRQIVSAHGGTIRVSSQPAAGATFTVELPRGPREQAPSL
ncbi:ATP-binding protein [Archangium lansingense]|uniref:ATP-binding protein n=1 Tax=Archangium lansingense TaxID=2995310 RepID=UPI003B7AEA3E